MSADKNVRDAVDNIEKNIAQLNHCLPTRFTTPIMYGYWPETNTWPELKAEGVTQYQEMIKVLRWSVNQGAS